MKLESHKKRLQDFFDTRHLNYISSRNLVGIYRFVWTESRITLELGYIPFSGPQLVGVYPKALPTLVVMAPAFLDLTRLIPQSELDLRKQMV